MFSGTGRPVIRRSARGHIIGPIAQSFLSRPSNTLVLCAIEQELNVLLRAAINDGRLIGSDGFVVSIGTNTLPPPAAKSAESPVVEYCCR